ncbi:unnamed protein product [Cuscuta epithymum]|uniref:Uncharacterized protein n=1 Tax=Cuscuta epithymum TaxID=186058 RepID=A0AAV0BY14_9ASTE|nr:unnamed protein product [Cuscuta epithymum]
MAHFYLPCNKTNISKLLVFTSTLLIIILSIKPLEATRSFPDERLLLPSLQWKHPNPPERNPGTNKAPAVVATLGEKHFAAVENKNKNVRGPLLLPSLWKSVKSPTPNPGTNTALVGEKNFGAVGLPRKVMSSSSSDNHLLLPSLQWRKPTPPSGNPTHNG